MNTIRANMSQADEGVNLGAKNPLIGVDVERLEREMTSYHQWLDERADDAYRIAEQARQQGLDHKDRVEIPRASDLAGRTEKLLIEHLEGYEVADDIRNLLEEHDRETTSIIIAQSVARGFRDSGYDLEKSIDVGLRVGLAVLDLVRTDLEPDLHLGFLLEIPVMMPVTRGLSP